MNLNIGDLRRVAADAAREISSDLHVTGVVLSATGSEYAEVLVTIEGGRNDGHRIAVGVRRKPPLAELREHLAAKLRQYYSALR